ncbi:SIR2 family NAD-dependent protein deacylase [Snodgrassella alvi]|uniref:SIR2 family NAD-dependent protein deacylase n=1 Tax=Snodgrassella alvi TaxID=1196083 RepID=UPI000C1EB917|nr:Sir2 family NAD-dependent protein deacetylase [Snodgrassella alvi]PIT15676.1 NAD-dependent protein deacylase [Snodgrassella alvi]PIT18092.1 NAD-dependent protein deacylase [Snodgrassella alvi]
MSISSTRQRVVVLTGSGISAESGLQTFRNHGGLWDGERVDDVATPEAFARNPLRVLDFYNRLRHQLQNVQPNAAHLALRHLESGYDVNIITQNVDDLHERAGSSHVLHLHGELLKARSSVDENYIVDCFSDQTMADVDVSGFLMRPHIVWFGEAVPMIEPAIQLMRAADIAIIIGTSLQVYPAAGLVQYIPPETETFLIDPQPYEGLQNVQFIRASAQAGVSSLVRELLRRPEAHSLSSLDRVD